MKIKESQLHQQIPKFTEWPNVLTPEQRDQLIREKLAVAALWHKQLKKHDFVDSNAERS
jgi:hypothetical protein